MPKIDKRHLALALVQALQMWSNPYYKDFLHSPKTREISAIWFAWFIGAWNVARTIKDGKQPCVRDYLDCEFRRRLFRARSAETVDAAADFIQRQGWSSRRRKDGNGARPISLVSKIAFFLSPNEFVPLDSYSLKGLNVLRRQTGARIIKGKSYGEYLQAFDTLYATMEPRLNAALKERWVAALGQKLGCPPSGLRSKAMRRKLLDNYLMHTGEYKAPW